MDRLSKYKNEEGESAIQSILDEMAYYDDMQPMVNAIIKHCTRDGETDISSFIDHYFGDLIKAEDEKFEMETVWLTKAKAEKLKYIDEQVHIDDLNDFIEWTKEQRGKKK